MLTLSMIVKNEEKYLNDCLESVRGVADEIIIVDTGSTDSTMEIAEKFGAKIFDFNWVNDFSAARNFALSKSKGDWILYLDADERLSQNSIEELKRITSKKEKKAYFCSIISADEIKGRQSTFTYLRLFANSEGIAFTGKVHEQIEPSLTNKKYVIESSEIVLVHLGYNVNQLELEVKANRNLELLFNEFKNNPSSYNAYQIAQTYGILKKKDDAVKYFNIALKDNKLTNEYKSLAYRFLSVDATDKGDYNTAKDLIEKSLIYDKEQPLALLVAAKICCKLNKYEEAETYTTNAFNINKAFLEKKKKSSQTIYLTAEDFNYHALEIALNSRNTELYNKFFNKLFNITSTNLSLEKKTEYEFFELLMNDKPVREEVVEKYCSAVNSSNYGIIIEMLKKYNQVESKTRIYYELYKTMKTNPDFLNEFGIYLSVIQQFLAAREVFESSYELNPLNPPTVFYLISIYLNTQELSKIKPLISSAKINFSNDSQILEKLTAVENKLAGII